MRSNKVFRRIRLGSCTYNWPIDSFSYFSRQPKAMLSSPSFMVPNTKLSVCLNLYPGGYDDQHRGHVSIFLRPARKNLWPVTPEIEANLQVMLRKDRAFFCFSKTTDVDNFEDPTSPGFFRLMDHDSLEKVLKETGDRLHIVCNATIYQRVLAYTSRPRKIPYVSLKRVHDDDPRVLSILKRKKKVLP